MCKLSKAIDYLNESGNVLAKINCQINGKIIVPYQLKNYPVH